MSGNIEVSKKRRAARMLGMTFWGGVLAVGVLSSTYAADITLSPPLSRVVTRVTLSATGFEGTDGGLLPVTFGQVFKPGDIGAQERVVLYWGDRAIATQMDVKARHADGSVKHAVLSALVPAQMLQAPVQVDLTPSSAPADTFRPDPLRLAPFGINWKTRLTVDGVPYEAAVAPADLTRATRWLDGAVVREYMVSTPLRDARGVEHPHLHARWYIYQYNTTVKGIPAVRADVVIENDWAYRPAPAAFTYDADFAVGGQTFRARTGLTHHSRTRWRQTYWNNEPPRVQVAHDAKYLIETKAVPNYDPNLVISPKVAADYRTRMAGKDFEPMGPGLTYTYMPATGGRPDIGPLPKWAAAYLLSQDPTLKEAMLRTADLAGSWPVHYRDELRGHPLSIRDYPYANINRPSDAFNPVTRQSEALPSCASPCKGPLTPDTSHQPALVYLPYLVTGDHYYLDELLFWTGYNSLSFIGQHRGLEKGLVKPDQVRGQAWSLRTLAQAAYITPDDHPQKAHLELMVRENLNFYNERLTFNPNANRLGFNEASSYVLAYNSGLGMAPWQDDFFTWTVGYVKDLGFREAAPLHLWKAKFVLGRMGTDSYCWIRASQYSLNVRSTSTSPFYTDFRDVYQANFATVTNSTGQPFTSLQCASQPMADWFTQKEKDAGGWYKWQAGEMVGYSASATGYPSNFQPALASIVDPANPATVEAWKRFAGRSVKPDYGLDPQWAVVPRL